MYSQETLIKRNQNEKLHELPSILNTNRSELNIPGVAKKLAFSKTNENETLPEFPRNLNQNKSKLNTS